MSPLRVGDVVVVQIGDQRSVHIVTSDQPGDEPDSRVVEMIGDPENERPSRWHHPTTCAGCGAAIVYPAALSQWINPTGVDPYVCPPVNGPHRP